MQRINLSNKLFWVISFFVITASLAITFYQYQQTLRLAESSALSRAKILQNYFMSMRYVYHHQFLDSGIDLNDSTVGFLPAHAASLISDQFSIHSHEGISIRNVSDRPRNPHNKADNFELMSIRYFINHPQAKEQMSQINQDGKDYYFFTAPIKIQPYCISCHGKKEEVLPYIARRYTTAYDYKVGDVRGVTSIKIDKENLIGKTMVIFWKEVSFNWVIILFLLGLIRYAISEFTQKEVMAKQHLEKLVQERTADLKSTASELAASNHYQKHLFSILRTVADSNQILITTQSLNELISKTAECLAENEAFSNVKIALEKNGSLELQKFSGKGDIFDLLPIEIEAFEHNTVKTLNKQSKNIPESCRNLMESYDFTAIYAVALREDTFAKKALGVMSICTTQQDGFTPEEEAMIQELAGDIGFAINSFYQKENIARLSYYDPLTNLPNRRLMIDRLNQTMLMSERTQQYAALLFIDLDNFKEINDLKGHIFGDQILKETAQRVSNLLRESDTVSRFGGDEFVLLIENIGQVQQHAASIIQATAEKILNSIQEPFFIDEYTFYLSASIGITLFLDREMSIDNLLTQSDSAMYAAKNSGKNTSRFYDASLQEEMTKHAQMVQKLRAAVQDEILFVVYQPQVDFDGKIIGLEALVRWNDPQMGAVPPSLFIPIAEEAGLIIAIGQQVLQKAVLQIHEWKNDPIRREWRVSVNVSAHQFEDAGILDHITQLLDKVQISPSRLRLELTEGIFLNSNENILNKIRTLKSLGVSFSMDDFGTGYSSLSYLKHLPIDELKIDQSFVMALPESESDRAIIETIIAIGKTFNLEVIAEGVETNEQFDMLYKMGCNFYQGYLFSKPKLPTEI
ncbi:MAG: EAL domain-containing protein [Thiovulaceae bacterium]|nr:EAL domain-containing protein [Sulfurimonadaceae bacterium]